MTTPNEPEIPEGLLERCFSTIPSDATYKPTRPRLSPDSGSRVRLRWLSVAAAIPIVTVAAVIPLRKWLMEQKQIAALSKTPSTQVGILTEGASKKDFLRVRSWRMAFNTDFKSMSLAPSRAPKKYSLIILDRNKGIYDAQVTSDYQALLKPYINGTEQSHKIPNSEMIDPWDTRFFDSSLTLSEGNYYHWNGKDVSAQNIGKKAWQGLYNLKRDWAIAGFLSSPKEAHLIENRKVYSGTWKGETASVVEYCVGNDMKPSAGNVVFLYRLQFFIKPKDGLVIGSRKYVRAKYAHPHESNKEMLIGESDYSYAPTTDDIRHLDPANFLSEIK